MQKWSAARIKRLRKRYGESQPRFARRLGLGLAALQALEQDRWGPSGPTAMLLTILAEDVDHPRPHPDDVKASGRKAGAV